MDIVRKASEAHRKGAENEIETSVSTPNTSPEAISWLEQARAEDGIAPDGGIAVNPLAQAIAEHNANIENQNGNESTAPDHLGSPRTARKRNVMGNKPLGDSHREVLAWKREQIEEGAKRMRRLLGELKYNDSAEGQKRSLP